MKQERSIFSEEQRLAVYEKALDIHFQRTTMYFSLCSCMKKAIGTLFPEHYDDVFTAEDFHEFITNFPEFLSLRGDETEPGDYWFDPFDFEVRVLAMSYIINQLKPADETVDA